MNMPEKRSGTHRINMFLTDDAYQVFTNYVSSNYSAADAYGARSEVINNAVMSFCANPNIIINHISKADIQRVIEEHKETLDALADNDGRAEYEAQCAAAQSLAQAEAEDRWQQEQEEENRRIAEEHQGPEGGDEQ